VVGGSNKHPRRPKLRIVSGGKEQADGVEIDLATNTDPALEIDSMAQPVEVLLPYADKLIA
jgi:hypothetical protein